jgi:hypothetical protein
MAALVPSAGETPFQHFGFERPFGRVRALTGRNSMIRAFMIAAASATVLALSSTAFAQQPGQVGTAEEVKADQALALGMFNKGEGGFRDRDLYPFCFRNSDGKTLASPTSVPAGTDIRTLKDPTGKMFGVELYAVAQKPEGEITVIGDYMFPKPGTTAPTFPKVSFVTKVGVLTCGVGYYK